MGYTPIENINHTMTEVQPSVHKSRRKEKVHITVLVEGTQEAGVKESIEELIIKLCEEIQMDIDSNDLRRKNLIADKTQALATLISSSAYVFKS